MSRKRSASVLAVVALCGSLTLGLTGGAVAAPRVPADSTSSDAIAQVLREAHATEPDVAKVRELYGRYEGVRADLEPAAAPVPPLPELPPLPDVQGLVKQLTDTLQGLTGGLTGAVTPLVTGLVQTVTDLVGQLTKLLGSVSVPKT
jgi:hypothetical protein